MLNYKKYTKREKYLFGICLFLVIISFATASNFLAIQKNEGRMPVLSPYRIGTDKHFNYLEDSEINYPFLADRFEIGLLAFSLGDSLFFIGFLGVCFYSFKFEQSVWRNK